MNAQEIIELLRSLENPENKAGMARFGINTDRAFGISMKTLEPIARKIKKNYELALELWETGYNEARILAILIADPKKITPEVMDKWTRDFNSWDICDQAALKLYCKTPYAWQKVFEWADYEQEFVRRAAFATIAALCLHYKEKNNEPFEKSLELIVRYSTDERNFVKKAVNWALRQIGKRNLELNSKAQAAAERILLFHPNSPSARWIARDALRELRNEKTLERVRKKEK
ncbi:MAG TPA: DNA alkylation repair protein [Candidatus Kapabacteria bacterium]|jgi:3-methyladenine DNA glycosylase AlkD|nr:DNA alkylation repair protein [Candidatus Kapabacteria bacterium]HOM04667.1 DNA alkylation repair protein [Candidatus Kapabacteria bacterium]HPP38917.1 DNA alkylation repair protein [Candidatus Kapabacteria bacterium]HPU23105.1 DNA alkylation repair protein [Candidatus Kapabacteria bacterium]